MTRDEIKQRVCDAIDARRDEIIELGDSIFAQPELGYKEVRTAGAVAKSFRRMGLSPQTGLAVTGVRADLGGKRPGPRLAILGELDAVVCPGHRCADPTTGASHSCGHNGQIAAMVGAGIGLTATGAMQYLSGDVALFAVPAEEYVEIEWRQHLVKQGKIKFLGGKQELLANGHFDDIQMVEMVHLTTLPEDKKVSVGGTSNGFIGKLVRFKGKEAHAGGAPHLGVNALNAAMLALMGIHAQRETFKDQDSIRVHPILTKGGDLVNVIPADVRMETYVRGKAMDGILDANRKVNRAIKAGAYAVGAEVEITELPGYLPRINDPGMTATIRANYEQLVGAQAIVTGGHGTGSSDIGDLMHIMPGIHPMVGGCRGVGHSENYEIVDRETAYIIPAKALAMTAVDLLWEDAALAKRIIAEFKPAYTKESYLKMWEEVVKTGVN